MANFRSWLNLFGVLCLLCVMSASVSTQPTVSAQTDSCAGSLPSRLTVGDFARVTPGNANNVRIIPSRKGQLLGQIPGGETFKVTTGPKCAEGLNWWQVNYNGLIGWTVESDAAEYWLEPYDPNKPEVLTATNGVDYEYDGIHFELNPDLAARVTVSHLGAVISDPNVDVPQPFAPAGIEFTFTDANSKRLPLSLRVYSAVDYIRQEPEAKHSFATLRKQFVEDPGWLPPREEIPVLSIVRQPTLFRARVDELSFANGSGYRFLTQSSYDVRPIANPIEYRYSGLTYDNNYYVAAQAFVSSGLLSNLSDPADYGTGFEDRFESYRDGVVDTLTKAKGEEFTPNIDRFDDLIMSLQIGGPDFKVTTADGQTQVHFGITDFTVDSSLAQDVDYQIKLANWESMSPLPEHTCFSLQQNPLDKAEFSKQLCIFSAMEMQDYVKALERFLTDKPGLDVPDGRTRIPVPYNGAAQVMHAQVNYIDTDELQGVSFVTRYAQSDYFIGGDALEYNFSGVTQDRFFIVFLQYTVSTTLLPGQVPGNAELETLLENPLTYYKSVVDTLNTASPADFSPNLDKLDALIQSIVIK